MKYRKLLFISLLFISLTILGINIFFIKYVDKIDKETRTQCIDGMNISKTSIGDIFFTDEFNEVRIKCE
jgi:hypothetical protein